MNKKLPSKTKSTFIDGIIDSMTFSYAVNARLLFRTPLKDYISCSYGDANKVFYSDKFNIDDYTSLQNQFEIDYLNNIKHMAKSDLAEIDSIFTSLKKKHDRLQKIVSWK